jgi:hypothetical protein
LVIDEIGYPFTCSRALRGPCYLAAPMRNSAIFAPSYTAANNKFAIFRAAKDARKMADFLTGRLVLEAAPEPVAKPEKMPAPSVTVKPLPEPALANAEVNAILTKVRTTSKTKGSTRRSGLVPVGALLGVGVGAGQSLGS